MPVTQDRLTRLREFGLSEYGARAYLALLDLGIAEARDVSSISKVPQAKIYHVLEQLHEKGLVVILPEFPKKYAPVPFEEYLQRLYDQHTKQAQAIESERESLAEMFRVMGETAVGDRGFFTVIRGRRNVLSKIEEMLSHARHDLLVLGTAGGTARMTHFLAEFKSAVQRGVKLRLLLPIDKESLANATTLGEVADVRAREATGDERADKVAIVVVDSTTAFLIHFVPDDANLYVGKDIGVFTDQEAMVAAIQAIVDPHWIRATRLDRRREEILHGRAPEFTRIYTSDDEARAELQRALKAGADDVLSVGWPDIIPADARRWRAVEMLTDARAVDERAGLVAQAVHVEVRHLRTPMIARNVVIDSREALFRIGGSSSSGRSEVIIHTNAEPVVQAMRAHFETLWSHGSSLDERRHELEIFPGLQPGDIGIGRLFHLMRDAVVVANPEARVALWNPAAATIFRQSARDARGLDISLLVAPAARAAFVERIGAFREKAQPGEDAEFFETAGVREREEEFPMEVTLSLLSTPEGARYLVLVARDITIRKRGEEALRHAAHMLSATLDATPDGILVISREGKVTGHNQKFREMWRIPAEVMATGDDEHALAVASGQLVDPEGFLRKVRALYASPDDESFDVLHFKDGRVFERVSKPQRLDGEVVGRVWSFRDVTAVQPASAKTAPQRRS